MGASLIKLKTILREAEMPMFTDEQLTEYLSSSSSFEQAAYELLLIKSENTAVQLSGLSLADTSAYYKRLAQMYRPFNSGVIG